MPYTGPDISFNAPFAPQEADVLIPLFEDTDYTDAEREAIHARATRYINAIRNAPKGAGLEDFMQEYSLSTKEGLALMVLAEALLRVPDPETQDDLIEDKLSSGNWEAPDGDEGWLLMAASWGIGLGARVVRPGETPGNVLTGLVRRLGVPVVRTGTRQAMQYLGYNFVLGQNIGDAIKRAGKGEAKGYRFSYDMLGEGARTWADADRYLESYAKAIDSIGKKAKGETPADRPGISVKLSALSPRFRLRNRPEVLSHMVPKVLELARTAKQHNLGFTVDAEEADRLEIGLDVFGAVARDPSLEGWDGFGLAVQAYQKRAPNVVQYVTDLAEAQGRRFMMRLVKGAYWDTEIKRAQERGLSGFPVFTRKAATDLCYVGCAHRMLDGRDRLYPQFATHNALTIATIIEMGGKEGYEFQRLHGMGNPLFDAEVRDPGVPVRVYAPVGGYRDLLAYLVRRMLENAANSSFVAQVADERISDEDLLAFPTDKIHQLVDDGEPLINPRIRLPGNLYPDRRNSQGYELGHRPDLQRLTNAAENWKPSAEPVTARIGGSEAGRNGETRQSVNPATGEPIRDWVVSDEEAVAEAVGSAQAAFHEWNAQGAHARAVLLRRYADVLESHTDELIGTLTHEAGKSYDDGVAEVREAVDFCRFYANEAERLMPEQELPGPTGETNTYALQGRGVFACIAPWNFPLAIFLGQAVAAMAAGNTVVAKPAEQTPLIATLAASLMTEAGIPDGVLNVVLGGGPTGAALTSDPRISGVAFTGSTKTAKAINRSLAERDGPILPFIAETGGLNAMVVDSTALPEQVADDVVASAFLTAGQRCSALRVLYLQDSVADRMLEMIVGAAKGLVLGDTSDPDTDLGPVIDETARERLEAHWQEMKAKGRVVWQGEAPEKGTFFAPRIVELGEFDAVKEEAFGPILHVCRWKGDKGLEEVMKAIRGTGYGLTFGLHTRLDGRAEALTRDPPAGNAYVNRNMVGAVVGVQPFGGRGLSGTGPKAGGPLYLTRFCEERTVTVNTAAAGGNASLIALSDE